MLRSYVKFCQKAWSSWDHLQVETGEFLPPNFLDFFKRFPRTKKTWRGFWEDYLWGKSAPAQQPSSCGKKHRGSRALALGYWGTMGHKNVGHFFCVSPRRWVGFYLPQKAHLNGNIWQWSIRGLGQPIFRQTMTNPYSEPYPSSPHSEPTRLHLWNQSWCLVLDQLCFDLIKPYVRYSDIAIFIGCIRLHPRAKIAIATAQLAKLAYSTLGKNRTPGQSPCMVKYEVPWNYPPPVPVRDFAVSFMSSPQPFWGVKT